MEVLIEVHSFPSILYMALLAQSQNITLEIKENYQKRSYRNRVEVLGSNGKTTLSIPLEKGKNEQMPIENVLISEDQNWRLQWLRTLKTCYGKTAYYDFYKSEIESCIMYDSDQLLDFNLHALKQIFPLIGQEVSFRYSDKYEKVPSSLDFRNAIHPRLNFDASDWNPYPQAFEDRLGFTPNLSVLDLLFNLGPETKSYLQNVDINLERYFQA